jgi:predicted RNase H-like HicB family nuclease
VTHVVHVPYIVEQDEDGVWCASAQLRPGVAAFGDGPTQEAAIADLRVGLELLIEEVGIPDELTPTLNVARSLIACSLAPSTVPAVQSG